jgi:ribonuclease HI
MFEAHTETVASWTLPGEASVLTAELAAIARALLWAARLRVGGRVHIWSDSSAAVQTVLRGDHQSDGRWWRSLALIYARVIGLQGGAVSISWVPGHRDIAGNEQADLQAKAGARGAGTVIASVPTKREIKLEIQQELLGEWQRRWEVDTKGRHRFAVDSTIQRRYRPPAKRRDDVLLTRLRLGTVRLAGWRATILRDGDGHCAACGAPWEDLLHLLLRCRAWQHQRERLRRDCGVGPGAMSRWKLLGDLPTGRELDARVGALRRFLVDTRRLEWITLAG